MQRQHLQNFQNQLQLQQLLNLQRHLQHLRLHCSTTARMHDAVDRQLEHLGCPPALVAAEGTRRERTLPQRDHRCSADGPTGVSVAAAAIRPHGRPRPPPLPTLGAGTRISAPCRRVGQSAVTLLKNCASSAWQLLLWRPTAAAALLQPVPLACIRQKMHSQE